MFFLFHHMPKCGGTSFVAFLRSVCRVTPDYVGANHLKNPDRLIEFQSKRVDLARLNARDCLVGHYNLKETRLSSRYPDLNTYEHRKFSILRDPYEAALSGLRYQMKSGWLSETISEQEKFDRLLKRASYFSRVFGVGNEDDIEQLFDKYWFIAPLDRIDHAMRILEIELGITGARPDRLNQTRPDNLTIPVAISDQFRDKARLDYAIFETARIRFGALAGEILRTPPVGRGSQGALTRASPTQSHSNRTTIST